MSPAFITTLISQGTPVPSGEIILVDWIEGFRMAVMVEIRKEVEIVTYDDLIIRRVQFKIVYHNKLNGYRQAFKWSLRIYVGP